MITVPARKYRERILYNNTIITIIEWMAGRHGITKMVIITTTAGVLQQMDITGMVTVATIGITVIVSRTGDVKWQRSSSVISKTYHLLTWILNTFSFSTYYHWYIFEKRLYHIYCFIFGQIIKLFFNRLTKRYIFFFFPFP